MPKRKSEEEELEDILEELDEDEELEDDEELDDEDDEEDEDDEDEEDPDEAPRKAKSRSKKAKKTKAAKRERTGIGTQELADAAGVDSRRLRMYLRSEGIEKTEGRYEWKSLNDPQAKAIVKGIKEGKLKEIQNERLENLKGKKAAKSKKSSAKTTKSKTKTRRKK